MGYVKGGRCIRSWKLLSILDCLIDSTDPEVADLVTKSLELLLIYMTFVWQERDLRFGDKRKYCVDISDAPSKDVL